MNRCSSIIIQRRIQRKRIALPNTTMGLEKPVANPIHHHGKPRSRDSLLNQGKPLLQKSKTPQYIDKKKSKRSNHTPWLCPILAPHYSKHCSSGDDLSPKLSWIPPLRHTKNYNGAPKKKIFLQSKACCNRALTFEKTTLSSVELEISHSLPF